LNNKLFISGGQLETQVKVEITEVGICKHPKLVKQHALISLTSFTSCTN